MKIVIPGGTGQVGRVLVQALRSRGDEVIVLGRGGSRESGVVAWDGGTLGAWADAIDGADAVINLAGRSVNCRYHKTNLAEMLASRIDSTRVLARAIERASRPPRVWLQASTATIYSHRFDAANDEATGIIGGHEPDAPPYWRFSIEIAEAWERELAAADTPRTRRVAMRMAIVMAPDRDGTFGILHRLARLGLGGSIAG
ncbi:MAG: NAD-dependent epimerase/dehydratase family protein, partial [Gemmatimonadetes bacterium]|nr:NAD-dependent epimerase/dehydratase family protein [Gemmatimonadota bacterium]